MTEKYKIMETLTDLRDRLKALNIEIAKMESENRTNNLNYIIWKERRDFTQKEIDEITKDAPEFDLSQHMM